MEYPKEFLLNLDLCWHCGVCFPFCNRPPRLYSREGPQKKGEDCEDCVICVAICPRVYPKLGPVDTFMFGQERTDEEFGVYRRLLTAWAKEKPEKAQDGGLTSMMVKYMLAEKKVDAAILTANGAEWEPETYIATDPADVDRAAGSKYSRHGAGHMMKVASEKYERVAFVGLPCQISALRRMQMREEYKEVGDRIVFTIGLICCATFLYDKLKDYTENEVGFPIKEVTKFDITKGKLYIYRGAELHTTPLKKVQKIYWPTCFTCSDATAEFADITFGAVGSDPGENSVLIRTPYAEEIFAEMVDKGLIEYTDIRDVERLRKFVEIKREKVASVAPETWKDLTKRSIRRNLETLDPGDLPK